MTHSRRNFIGKSAFGIFGLASIGQPFNFEENQNFIQDVEKVNPHYPSTDSKVIREVVGAAHARFDRVKELVTTRPELAKATWDWGFGDVESALEAASHMGRKDIAEFLMEHGARPNIFTFAMLGKMDTIKSMIADMPDIPKMLGAHGFTLLFHAKIRLIRKNVEGTEKKKQEALVSYLTSLGNADIAATDLGITEEEKKIYIGKYAFGTGEDEYFEVKLNMREMLSMGRGKDFGRTLLRIDKHTFAPGGAPSVKIKFEVKDGVAQSVTIHDPSPILKSVRM